MLIFGCELRMIWFFIFFDFFFGIFFINLGVFVCMFFVDVLGRGV